MAKLQEEKKKKKEMDESENYLKEIDKGGVKTFLQYQNDEEKREQKLQDNILNDLDIQKQRTFTYQSKIAEYGTKKLKEIDYPKGWEYACVPTSDRGLRLYGQHFDSQFGVLVILKSPKGDIYTRGLAPLSFNPGIDMKGINILAEQAENTVDSAKGLLYEKDESTGMKKTKGGILLPN